MFDFYAISGKDTFTKIAPQKEKEKEEGKKKIQVLHKEKKDIYGVLRFNVNVFFGKKEQFGLYINRRFVCVKSYNIHPLWETMQT